MPNRWCINARHKTRRYSFVTLQLSHRLVPDRQGYNFGINPMVSQAHSRLPVLYSKLGKKCAVCIFISHFGVGQIPMITRLCISRSQMALRENICYSAVSLPGMLRFLVDRIDYKTTLCFNNKENKSYLERRIARAHF
jgi:hypothetical protein